NIFLIWIGAHKSTLLEWKYLKENHNLHFLKQIIFQQFLSCVQLFLHAIEKLHSHHHPISAVILSTFLWIDTRKSTLHDWKYLNEHHMSYFLKRIAFHHFLLIIQQALHKVQPPHHPNAAAVFNTSLVWVG